MKKKILIPLLLIMTTLNVNAQLKVVQTGSVGIGTNAPNPSYNLTLMNKGGLVHYKNNEGFRAGSSGGSAIVGSSADKIDFWYSAGTGHNNVVAQSYAKQSDSTTKSGITPLSEGLETVMNLNTYSYTLKGAHDIEYGFLSQEVQRILPTITDTSKGVLVMDYDQIIPFLVKGTQEQQKMILTQDSIINSLIDEINELQSNVYNKLDVNDNVEIERATLYQNQPNPFKESTAIKFDLPNNFGSANILIFDMKGTLLKDYPIYDYTREIKIQGKELKAGMYMYSLIVDNVEVDTKKMILQK